VSPLRVVIADDHPFYRMGLVRSLRARGIDVVAEAPNGAAALRAVEETDPDVVVMDLRMPGLSGIEVTRKLTEREPASRVLVLSVSAEEDDVAAALRAGASGYVLKDRPVEDVIAGIEAAASGGGAQPPPVHLTARELDVIDLMAEGNAENEVAATLGITPSTVRSHAASILTKLATAYRRPRA
jgi:DNA-binding NarL/FixJ family response regulator